MPFRYSYMHNVQVKQRMNLKSREGRLCFLRREAGPTIVLAERSLLAFAYEPAGRRSNYKLKYLTMYRSNLLLNLCYHEHHRGNPLDE
jgi:hypothetical protein